MSSPTENPTVEELRKKVPSLLVSADCSWSRYSSLGAGTAVFLLARPADTAQLKLLLKAIRELGKKSFVIGGGTNLVGSDSPLEDTVFIKLGRGNEFSSVSLNSDGTITAGATVGLREIIDFAQTNGLGGASGLSGIPGTLGGALVMNAGACGVEIGKFVKEVHAVDVESSEELVIPASKIKWDYRSSSLVSMNLTITGAVLSFEKVETATERLKIEAETERRKKSPQGRSAGSIFRNPSPDMPAGRLLEEAGCKGMSAGAFCVSLAHANWIVNAASSGTGEPGRESDFIRLAVRMASAVKLNNSVALKPEVRFVCMSSGKIIEKALKPLKVLVLKGGTSSEREVSLESGAAVAKALREGGHDVREFDIKEIAMTSDMKWADVVFPVLHGGFGEDGRIQKLFEDNRIKFVGSGSDACRLLMDKVASKELMNKYGVPNAKYAVLDKPGSPVPAGMNFPLIVKPPCEGSTVGLSLVDSRSEWDEAISLALKYDKAALVEEYIEGVEATIGILLGKPLPLIELRYPGKIYDYDAKYTHAKGETKYICPPTGISEKAQKKAQEAALKFYEKSGARDILRIDVIVSSKDDSIYVLEGNSIPGCTASSLVPKAAKAAGISFVSMCCSLVAEAFAR